MTTKSSAPPKPYVTQYSEGVISVDRVAKDFEELVGPTPKAALPKRYSPFQTELAESAARFKELAVTRNYLVHGHPYTASDQTIQLAYSGRQRFIPLPLQSIQQADRDFDEACAKLSQLFDRLEDIANSSE